jgi:hypothetical protein
MSSVSQGGSERRTDAPIFIIGTERSGSNLVRLILNAHSEIAAPHPPHFVAYFWHLEKYYGDLSIDANFEHLLEDLLVHVRGHIHPWPFIPSLADLRRQTQWRDLFAASYAFYDRYAAESGKRIWSCKSTFMIDHCDRILAHYPDAKLIWLVRDPRDVALSSMTSVFNPYHPYYTARLWRKQQERGLKLETELPASTIRRLHYEDLVCDPARTVADICRFVRVAFEQPMLKYFDTPDARTSSALSRDWRNNSRPILGANAGKFISGLSPAEIAIVEGATAPVMQVLGYRGESARPAAMPPSIRQLVLFSLRNEMLRGTAEYRSITRDRNGWARWRRALRMALLSASLRLKPR